MKRYIIHLSAILALLLAAAACTQDDAVLLPEAPEGIPMTFTAKGLNPTAATTTGTRATVDGDWKGVTAVAIQIGNEVKAYRVTPSADNLTATLSSDDPHYWAGESAVTVSAWWPYTDGQTSMPAVTVQADHTHARLQAPNCPHRRHGVGRHIKHQLRAPDEPLHRRRQPRRDNRPRCRERHLRGSCRPAKRGTAPGNWAICLTGLI